MQKLLTSFVYGLMALCITVVVLLVSGFVHILTVDGISMQPHLHTGDMALVRKQDHYRVGDVVSYHARWGQESSHLVLHRIRSIQDGKFVLRGDNNPTDDPVLVSQKDIVGQMIWHMPRVGTYIMQARQSLWVMCFFLALLLIFRSPKESDEEVEEFSDETEPSIFMQRFIEHDLQEEYEEDDVYEDYYY